MATTKNRKSVLAPESVDPGAPEYPNRGRTGRAIEWLGRHSRLLMIGVIVLTIAAVPAAMATSDEEPEFSARSEVWDTADLVEERFATDSRTEVAKFIVEADADADILTRDALLEWQTNVERLRADEDARRHLVTSFDRELGVEVAGVYSIADEVAARLGNVGGLEAATDSQVKAVLAELLGDATTSSLAFTLSQRAQAPGEAGSETAAWTSPAFMASVAYDPTSFAVDYDGDDPEILEDEQSLAAETWLREAQDTLRGGQRSYAAYGVGIDGDLTMQEQGMATAPYIMAAIVLVVALVGILLRSYWAGAFVTAGLAVMMIWLSAIVNLVGIKTSMLITFIVPIAAVAFGVDFFIHAISRAREFVVDGHSRSRAYPLGLTAVAGALALALASSAAAFLANAVSGIEAIVGFGVAAAVALAIAYLLLGLLAPKAVLGVEDRIGVVRRGRRSRVASVLGFVAMAFVGGATVTAAVLMPLIGTVALTVFVGLFLAFPYALAKRRTQRNQLSGKHAAHRPATTRSRIAPVGATVSRLAKWRVITLPVVGLLAVIALVGALRVDREFSFTDFMSSDTGFIVGLDLLEEHFGSSEGRTSYIYVEGDLAQPGTLAALDATVAGLDASDAELSREVDGSMVVYPSAVTIVRETLASDPALRAVESNTGVAVTDVDADGLADTPAQTRAIFQTARSQGVVDAAGLTVLPAEGVQEILWTDETSWATTLTVGIPTVTDAEIIYAAWDALDAAAADLANGPAGAALTRVGVSGDSILDQAGLDSFTRAMLLALPIALVLAIAVAALFMRSLKYAAVSVLPVLLVVVGVYGFMHAAGYAINPVTSTIAAIAVGVGIDFATHFTMRFREELNGAGRLTAVRRAGDGTGAALVISALTSLIGFTVMAFAPMPIFAVFGVLTAVMIALSLLVSLTVLPSLLVIVTPRSEAAAHEPLLFVNTPKILAARTRVR